MLKKMSVMQNISFIYSKLRAIKSILKVYGHKAVRNIFYW